MQHVVKFRVSFLWDFLIGLSKERTSSIFPQTVFILNVLLSVPFISSASSGRSGLVGQSGVALVRGSIRHFHLHAGLLLIHQQLGRQTPAAQTRLEQNVKRCETTL